MTKLEILEMLRELVRYAYRSHTDPDDYSGCNTKYYVDQEKLMANIEQEIEKILNPEEERLEHEDDE